MALQTPIKFIKGTLSSLIPTTDKLIDVSNGINSPGIIYKYTATITAVMAQVHSHPLPINGVTGFYDARHININDYIASSRDGRALKIIAINNVQPSSISVTLEDVNGYNYLHSDSQDGAIQSGTCYIFSVVKGKPLLTGTIASSIVGDMMPLSSNIMARFEATNPTSNDDVGLSNVTNVAQLPYTQTLTHTGDVTAPSTALNTGTVALTLANSGVTAGTYGSATNIPVITFDSKGRATSASTVAVSIPSGSISVTGGDITMSGTTGTAITNATLATITDSNTGSFLKLNKNTKGLVTGTTAVTQSDITGLLGTGSITNLMLANGTAVANLSGTNTGDETLATIKTKLGITTLSGVNTGDQTITLTGDVTGTGTGSFAATLANITDSNTGSFLKLNKNTKGLVTGTTAVTQSDITGLLGSGSITSTMLSTSGVTAGTYTQVTVDSKGRVTSAGNIANATTTVSGLFSSTDKTKLDSYPTPIAGSSVLSLFNFTLTFDGNGYPVATTPTDLPAGWTYSVANTTEVTITHTAGVRCKMVTYMGKSSDGFERVRMLSTSSEMKIPTANVNTVFKLNISSSLAGADQSSTSLVTCYF